MRELLVHTRATGSRAQDKSRPECLSESTRWGRPNRRARRDHRRIPRSAKRRFSSSMKTGYLSTARMFPEVRAASVKVCPPLPHPTSKMAGDGGNRAWMRRKASDVASGVPGPWRGMPW
jgi:hypothetical protein